MTFKRPSIMSVQAYLNEFDKRLFKIKPYGTMTSDGIVAYRLLKSVNLSSRIYTARESQWKRVFFT